MLRAIVLVNAYIRAPSMLRQAARVAEELRLRGVQTEIVRNGCFLCSIEDSSLALAQKPDFVVNLDKDKYLSRMLEKCGVRLFNSADAVELCDDKMLTGIVLAGNGLRLPDTMPAPLCYYADAQIPGEYVRKIGKKLGYPLVVKKSFGSWGDGVRLVPDEAELRKAAEEWKQYPHFYQKRIGKPGEDYRILVIGGRTVACMRRINERDFRSNVEQGGHGEAAEPSPAFLAAAERCAALLGLDYCGVDLIDEQGTPYVCEVNSNAMFNEAERVTGVNIAGAYAEHMLRVISEAGSTVPLRAE